MEEEILPLELKLVFPPLNTPIITFQPLSQGERNPDRIIQFNLIRVFGAIFGFVFPFDEHYVCTSHANRRCGRRTDRCVVILLTLDFRSLSILTLHNRTQYRIKYRIRYTMRRVAASTCSLLTRSISVVNVRRDDHSFYIFPPPIVSP